MKLAIIFLLPNINSQDLSKMVHCFLQSTVSAKTVKSSELEDIWNGSRHHNSNTGIGSSFWKPTKVSVLARDLVLKFKGEYVDDSDKKQVNPKTIFYFAA